MVFPDSGRILCPHWTRRKHQLLGGRSWLRRDRRGLRVCQSLMLALDGEDWLAGSDDEYSRHDSCFWVGVDTVDYTGLEKGRTMSYTMQARDIKG